MIHWLYTVTAALRQLPLNAEKLSLYERVGATVDNCCLSTKHDFNFRFNLSTGLPISYVAFDYAIKPSVYKAITLSFFPRDLTLLLFKCKSKSTNIH